MVHPPEKVIAARIISKTKKGSNPFFSLVYSRVEAAADARRGG
jgi:hypothetical protein